MLSNRRRNAREINNGTQSLLTTSIWSTHRPRGSLGVPMMTDLGHVVEKV